MSILQWSLFLGAFRNYDCQSGKKTISLTSLTIDPTEMDNVLPELPTSIGNSRTRFLQRQSTEEFVGRLMRVCVYVCMYVCMNICMNMYVYMYIYIYVCMYVCMYDACMHVCLYIYIYICMYTHTHIYIYEESARFVPSLSPQLLLFLSNSILFCTCIFK